MDPILFNAEHALLQPANDDSHDKYVRDYPSVEQEITHFITDEMWRRGGII